MAARYFLIFSALLLFFVRSQQQNVGANGAVTSEVEVCSEVGIGLLRSGGSAADAVSSPFVKTMITLTCQRRLVRRSVLAL
jgi:gamma-glutamyltranspeptidase